MARRFEVYGTKGSAIIMEPFEPARVLRLVLEEAGSGYEKGLHLIEIPEQGRQETHDIALAAFIATITGLQAPDRPLAN